MMKADTVRMVRVRLAGDIFESSRPFGACPEICPSICPGACEVIYSLLGVEALKSSAPIGCNRQPV